MIRKPVVAGAFYPGNERELVREMREMVEVVESKQKVIGLISPHAGYVYSGSCAGKGFGRVEVPDTVILLGVNHHGLGHAYAVDGHDKWSTPLGEIEVDTVLRDELVRGSEVFAVDSNAGLKEHSLEVQVPFIQYINPRAKILPIAISSVNRSALIAGGHELARLIKDRTDILMVSSTDMSHYIDADTAKKRDTKAIEKILELDAGGLFETVGEHRITMCGVAPTTMMLAAAVALGAKKAEIIEYTHSGKVSGDYYQVVAYLSLMVY